MERLIQYFIEDERCLGYVWKQERGQRVVIVVDDCFKLVEYDNPPNAFGFGLKVIFDKLSCRDDTLAIGFFDLPQSPKIPDIVLIINTIKTWISELDSHNYKLYLLVDYFHGQQTMESKANGLKFVDYWHEHQPLPAEKIAYLSLGGVNTPNHYRLQCFQKTLIHDQKADYKLLPEDFLHWLDIDEHPLFRLWRYSNRWFLSDDTTILVKHNFAVARKFLFDQKNDTDLFQAGEYKRKISNALEVNIPNAWWENEESAKNIHESLKCLCGAFFCGQTNNNAKRHLSVGAAYLIALMAHQKIYGNGDVFMNDTEAWIECSQAASPIFALQDQETARTSAIALYDCFICLFTPRSKNAYQESFLASSQVRNICFYESGRVLKIQLNWNAQNPSSDRQENLAKTISPIFKQQTINVSQFAKNTRNSVLNLWCQMAISDNGFMSPGAIYMEGDTVVVASIK
ncbi:hypothetical protein [Nostoc sphaeroides]|uniref:High-affnity carbon uptake protein Hat/HatR n=1 Tax=Nostoc sphaeroides CCNUC1 TaxID=2653204 RepID=A0A5P8WJE4_9NOSO|nr:hypothetical protein [Nostoc sphaeroides]QFS52266.1 High-affnity carbon uptake protein Hat/HatR [Nostoc sphaeroides CCNUC1]